MATMTDIRKRHVGLMRNTLETTQQLLTGVSQETATTYRDGGDGWTVLETLCHLRDFEDMALLRATMIIEQDMPDLPFFYHDDLVTERNYNGQDLQTVLAALVEKRTALREWFKALSAEQWERGGNHPERESFSMTDAVMQVGLHNATHNEQMLRILSEKR
ncbi:MAG: DinB family protein [Candidatus Promineifilaceae bacterium]